MEHIHEAWARERGKTREGELVTAGVE